jgi:hypothetical protein
LLVGLVLAVDAVVPSAVSVAVSKTISSDLLRNFTRIRATPDISSGDRMQWQFGLKKT